MEQLEYLLFGLPFKDIDWRVGSTNGDKTKGLALGYIDARDLMERLDDVVGGGDWQTFDKKDGDTYYCQLSVMGCTKTGGAGATDVESEKGGSSDAFKRAGYLFGIGRYLYNLKDHKAWVQLKPMGKSYAIDWTAETEASLNKALVAVSGQAYMSVLDKVTTKVTLEKLINHKIFANSLSIFDEKSKTKIMDRARLLQERLK